MYLKHLRVLGLIVALLLLMELALEYRAHRRGWGTILFGQPETVTAPADPDNVFPFRSVPVPTERTPGVTRLWMASSSHAEDIYVPLETTFPHQLAQRCTSPTEMLNASRAGSRIAGNVDRLAVDGPIWQPDIVLLYQMSLDVTQITGRLIGGAPEVSIQPTGIGGPARWVEETTTYQLLKEHLTTRFTEARVLTDDLGPDAVAIYRSRVESFIDQVRAIGAEPVLITFATSHDASNAAAMPSDTRIGMFRYNRFLSIDGWFATIDVLNDELRAIAAEQEVRLVDLDRALDGRPELFRDFVHFTPEGHGVVADTLASVLCGDGP